MSLYEKIRDFEKSLTERERAERTVQKYTSDLEKLAKFAGDSLLDKGLLVGFKKAMIKKYSPSSVNTIIAAVNSFLDFMGQSGMRLKPLKIQRRAFLPEERELTVEEYKRLVAAAQRGGNTRLALILQTICATGIRVSELSFITAEAVRAGRAVISCKGKSRVVFLPEKLQKLLKKYLKINMIFRGAVFVTARGNPPDRSNIWREMKRLCAAAGVEEGKVFPHNLRHLFARTYYSIEKDLSRLADILGHSAVNTTRIYTMERGKVHQKQINRLGLVLNTT